MSLATDVAAELRNVELEDNDVLYAMQELQEKLLDRLLHYQNVLDEHGVELPYHPRAEATDLVRLTPEIGDDDDSEHAG